MSLIRFILYPFSNLLYSINNLRSKDSKYNFFLFILFYSFCISLPEIDSIHMDLYKRIDLFNFFHSNNDFNLIFSGNIFESFLLFVVSSFTDNWRIMCLFWGGIIGYLNVSVIWHVINSSKQDFNSFPIKLMLVFLICSIPFWSIGVFRFFTAANIFILGFVKYLDYKKNKYLIFSILSVLVHWSFVFFTIFILIFLILKNLNSKKINLYVLIFLNVIFVISIFYNFLEDFAVLQNINFNYLPEFFKVKAEGYNSDVFIQRLQDLSYDVDNNFYVKSRFFLIYIFLQFLFLFYLKRRSDFNDFLKADIFFILIFICYLVYNELGVYSPYDRFAYIANYFVALLVFLFLNYFKSFRKSFFYRNSFLFFILYIIVEFRNAMDTFSILTLTSNPIIAFFMIENNFSLIDLFK